MQIVHEGFRLDLPNLTRYRENTKHRYVLLTMLQGEIDCIFLTNSLVKARFEVKQYYEHIYEIDCYTCEAFVRTDCPALSKV